MNNKFKFKLAITMLALAVTACGGSPDGTDLTGMPSNTEQVLDMFEAEQKNGVSTDIVVDCREKQGFDSGCNLPKKEGKFPKTDIVIDDGRCVNGVCSNTIIDDTSNADPTTCNLEEDIIVHHYKDISNGSPRDVNLDDEAKLNNNWCNKTLN